MVEVDVAHDEHRRRPRVERFAARVTIARALTAIGSVGVVLTVAGAVVIRAVEPETYGTLGEALWWSLQTVSTVGYGDIAPVSTGGGSSARR